ncbi:MAG: extracellular solute-binding protein [Planctomycetes bacterium]|nr:extracellular solute-binding protein [Planctomycetota bacterium]
MKRALVLFTILAAGCDTSQPEVTVYVSLDEMFSRPVLERFEAESGIRVLAKTDPEASKTVGLVNKLLAMKDRPEADVYWNNEPLRALVLKRAGLLEPIEPPDAADIPAIFRDPDGSWFGIAARARVILYNTELVAESEAPRSLWDFTRPEWKGRFAIADPLFGSTSTHVAALCATIGVEATEALLAAWKENGAVVVAGNSVARNMVMEGQIAACLTDTDDANEAIELGKPVRMVYPDQDGIGTLVFPNTILLIRGGPNPENGRKLVEFLAGREVESELARSRSAQMPVREGIPPHGPEFDLSRIRAMEVDYEKAAALLERSGAFVEGLFHR